jgi:8-oxo-dGTP pyrophosphatase MutT (NUDIX family)
MERSMTITPWKVVHSSYLVRDSWLTLRADRCEMANGVVIDPYYVQEPRDWVQVVAFDSQDRILITRQYRHGARTLSTELPCGTVEDGEAAIDAARRELLEETGCIPDQLLPLAVLSPNSACLTNSIHAFVATGARIAQDQKLDTTEEIEFEFLTIPELLDLIDAGAFTQALHVSSLFLALRQRQLLALKA